MQHEFLKYGNNSEIPVILLVITYAYSSKIKKKPVGSVFRAVFKNFLAGGRNYQLVNCWPKPLECNRQSFSYSLDERWRLLNGR